MPVRQRVQGPPLYRAVRADASIVDKDKRLIRLSFSSEEALVRRYDGWDGYWLERLGHDEDEVDLSWLNGGSAPVLWGHDSWSRASMVGVVERAWLEDKKGYAEIRLSGRDDVAGLLQDIEDAIVSNVSVGYSIDERLLVQANKDAPDEYRVTKWKPREISFVPIPADEGVGVGRSDDAAAPKRYIVTNIEERAMPDNANLPVPPASEQRRDDPGAPTNPPPAGDAAVREAATRAERERAAHIRTVVRTHNLGDEFERTALEGGHDVATVNRNVLEALVARQTPNNPRMTPAQDEVDKTREAAINWLLRKGGQKVDEALIRGNPYVGASLQDIARSRIQARGLIRIDGVYGDALARAAITQSTSDFPVLMENVMHKVIRAEFSAAPDTWRRFCHIGTVSDFRPHNSYASGSIGDLQDVGENGEIKHGKMVDGEREQVSAKSKALMITLSRAMIVNDDLGAFLTIAKKLGRSSSRTIENLAYFVLLANPVLKSDNKALFHADHGNLNASGGVPSVAAWDAVRLAMGRQKDVGANDFIGIVPAVWLGPDALRNAAVKVNSSENDPDVSNKNPQPNTVRSQFRDIVDSPRLTGNQWYAFADPDLEPTLQVSFLNGEQEPQVEMEEGFEVLGVRWRVVHDFGVDPVGYRGAQKVTW
jgi:hypothetical protein